MRTFTLRLHPGQDLRIELEAFARASGLRAPFVLTCVGTLSEDGPHLHLTVGDNECRVSGGHAQEGSLVRTTAEVVLGELDDVVFRRPVDPETGWDELVVEPRQAPAGR